MTLLSNLIKPNYYISLTDLKRIETIPMPIAKNYLEDLDIEHLSGVEKEKLAEIQTMQVQILRDAEEFAEEQVLQSMREAEQIREAAREEIEMWWQEKRSLDQQYQTEAQRIGFEEGYQAGKNQAQAAVEQQYAGDILESQTVLEKAYFLKEQIIKEAETFLIELSCAIAEKIICKQLTLTPEWVIEYTQTILSRRREKGLITICVSPQHFSYIQDAKDEFMHLIDSQAELQILPDSSVTDHGCVIRSPNISIDARIDTQLKEIKNALQIVSKRNEEAQEHG